MVLAEDLVRKRQRPHTPTLPSGAILSVDASGNVADAGSGVQSKQGPGSTMITIRVVNSQIPDGD